MLSYSNFYFCMVSILLKRKSFVLERNMAQMELSFYPFSLITTQTECSSVFKKHVSSKLNNYRIIAQIEQSLFRG